MPYVIPALLSAAVAFSGWSVTQHIIIGRHDQAQELRLSTIELRLTVVERNEAALIELITKVGIIDARQQIVLGEVAKLRGEMEQHTRRH